jgi:dipeptidyl aminopeptidase/acylaminoacyl peptidase
LLPAALYFADGRGQILRIAPDGTNPTPIVANPAGGIIGFDISKNGDLVYAQNDEAGAQLLLLTHDQRDPVVVLRLSGQSIHEPRWTHTGNQIAIGVTVGGQLAAGIYLVAGAHSATPTAIGVAPEATELRPISFAPDDTLLLVGTTIPEADTCGQASLQIATGTLTTFQPPAGTLTDCSRAAWSPNGKRILLTLQEPGASTATLPGLFQADPTTGAISALLAERIDPDVMRYAAPIELADQSILLFATSSTSADPPTPDALAWRYRIAHASPTGTLTQRSGDAFALVDAIWASDARGAVAAVLGPDPNSQHVALVWLPADGSTPTQLGEAEGVFRLAWGPIEH